jgi:neutral ceramidase
VQVLRVGSTALVGLPFEITVESGRRIGEAVRQVAADHGVDDACVCSLVNEYWGYVATEEEYGRQFYEGGHTIYGPNTERFLSAQAGRLAADAIGAGTFLDLDQARRAWSLRARRYLPRAPEGTPTERRWGGRAMFSDPTAKDDATWEQHWFDVAPGGLHWHEPLVRVERSDDGGATWEPAAHGWRSADDQGWALEILHLGGPDAGRHAYSVRWHDPDHRVGRMHRFVLLPNNGRPELAGEPFD